MGFNTHMIAGNPCLLHIHPADSPDHHQLDKSALCRGPARKGPTTPEWSASWGPPIPEHSRSWQWIGQ